MLRIFIWGTGWRAEQVLKQYDLCRQFDIIGFVDNDRNKWEKDFLGKKIYAPAILSKSEFDKVFILIDKYEDIVSQIKEMLGAESDGRIENYKYFYKKELLARYENSNDSEIRNILKYIREKDLQIYNYDFPDKYKDMQIEVMYDSECGMYYVWRDGKRMYFPKYVTTAEYAREYYRDLLIEQDRQSPHKYVTEEFDVEEGDVVIDAGAAEGFFALDCIDKAEKIYIIEPEKSWIEALEQTFKEYKDKVVIIPKCLTSINDGEFATLDEIIKEPINFIKMDIEGSEWDALLGAEKLIGKSENIKCAICSYHTDFDEILIRDILGKYGMECSTSNGYMWFHLCRRTSYVSTKLCRGVVRGFKNRKVRLYQ